MNIGYNPPRSTQTKAAGASVRLDLGPAPAPRERADEIAAARAWILRNRPALVEARARLSEPVDGGAALARLLVRLRATP